MDAAALVISLCKQVWWGHSGFRPVDSILYVQYCIPYLDLELALLTAQL